YHCSTPGSVYFAAAALALPPLWPLNRRVGANSPSLWPTMSSVTYSFMNCRPLWTRKFTPTNSGTMVQSRDQVLIGSRLPVRWPRSTFCIKRSSTYGPFFSDRLIATTPSGRRNYSAFEALVQGPSPLFRGVVRARPAAADDGRVGRLAL